MKYDSLFDVVGQLMVGPSSSHTAGACRIALVARKLFGKQPKTANIFLHGSFAHTYQGHGTDKALVAGILGIRPEDERLRKSFQIAKEQGLSYTFKTIDLGPDYHSNSVKIELKADSDQLSLIGSSIGGGNIIIKEINGLEAGFNADRPTLVTIMKDKPGVLAEVADFIAEYELNIASMHISRHFQRDIALSWIELTAEIPDRLLSQLEELKEVVKVLCVNV